MPKPQREDQPLNEPNQAVSRDLTGEEHPSPAPGEVERLHLVKPGDTLAGIAKQYYGDENEYEGIVAANRDRLGENDELVPGSELRIPE
jgi:nucleoid-associated protein YgaU